MIPKWFETEFLASCSPAFVAAYRAGDVYACGVVQQDWEQIVEQYRERKAYRRRHGRDPIYLSLD